MTRFVFTQNDKDDVRTAVQNAATADKAWGDSSLDDLKLRIKRFNYTKKQSKCCYCLRDFSNNYMSVIDTEHILPKSLWPKYTFTMKNLSISCKRCNSTIKKTRTDFLTTSILNKRNVFVSRYYRFLHPILDSPEGKLNIISVQTNSSINLIKYYARGEKGKYTYDYFKLNELEVASLNVSQGGQTASGVSDSIPDELLMDLQKILKKL